MCISLTHAHWFLVLYFFFKDKQKIACNIIEEKTNLVLFGEIYYFGLFFLA